MKLPVLIRLLGLLVVFGLASGSTSQTFHFTGKITQMHEADILTVRDEKNIEFLIRLKWIDCPDSGQAFYQDAQQMVKSYCMNKELIIKCDSNDMYGRTFAEVFLPDGRSMNKELVKFGYAWHYKRYSDDAEYADLESKARLQGRGLWQYSDPVPPWIYRRDDTVKVANYQGTFVTAPGKAGEKKERIIIGTGRKSGPVLAESSKKTEVVVCKEGGDNLYHRTHYCSELSNCSGTDGYARTSLYSAIKLYNRHECPKCH